MGDTLGGLTKRFPMPSAHENEPTTAEITRRSQSNLAFALRFLPAERRQDMADFYAFCRVIDDLADDPSSPSETKRAALARWRDGLGNDFGGSPTGAVERATLALREKYELPSEWLIEIVSGCEADIDVKRYATFEELRGYCYRVASVVGLVSARIFGCVRLESEKYAVNLGYALQITNILRDVGEDFREDGRIYLPAEDMARFDYGEEDLRAGRNDERFRALMEFEAARADAYFAASLGYLTAEDRPALRAAEGMRRIYSAILSRMRHDGFHVFEKRYRLSKPRMLWCVLRAYLG
jgi:phytoene synthase